MNWNKIRVILSSYSSLARLFPRAKALPKLLSILKAQRYYDVVSNSALDPLLTGKRVSLTNDLIQYYTDVIVNDCLVQVGDPWGFPGYYIQTRFRLKHSAKFSTIDSNLDLSIGPSDIDLPTLEYLNTVSNTWVSCGYTGKGPIL